MLTPGSHPRKVPIVILLLSLAGILGLLGRGIYLLVTRLGNADPQGLAATVLDSASMLFCAGLLVPMLVISIRQLKEKPSPQVILPNVRLGKYLLLFVGWVLIVIAGGLLAAGSPFGWAWAVPLFLAGISLPVIFILWAAIGGLRIRSSWRMWSVLGYGLLGGTLLSMLLESLVVAGVSAGLGLAAVVSPQLAETLDQVKDLIARSNSGDIQALLTTLAPYLTQPIVILGILVLAAVVTPLIEESLKPAVVWLLGTRLLTTAEGFTLGALCGAGFALLEGFLAASGSPQVLGFGMAGRAAASLMHITSSGLLGWGIASARLEKNYLRLILAWVAAVVMHGLWNGSAVLAVYGALRSMPDPVNWDLPGMLLTVGAVGMLLVLLLALVLSLPLINRRLRGTTSEAVPGMQSDIIPPL